VEGKVLMYIPKKVRGVYEEYDVKLNEIAKLFKEIQIQKIDDIASGIRILGTYSKVLELEKLNKKIIELQRRDLGI
jgi:hypothetical protein